MSRIPFFMRRTLGLLSRADFRYGEAVRLKPWESTWLLTDPADIRHVLTAHAANYRKTPHLASEEGRKRAGRGLITLTGPEHHDQRRMLHPAFRREAVARYEDVILDRTERMIAGWGEGERLDLAEAMAALAQANIVGTLFGGEFDDREGAIARAILDRRRYTEYHYHSRLPFKTHLPLPIVRNHRSALRTLDETIYRAIAERRRAAAERRSSARSVVSTEAPVPADLTEAFIQATYGDGSTMDDAQVRDEVMPLTVTGYETVGDALGWVFYLLARHPAVEARVLAELRDVIGDGRPGAADLPALAYTETVLAESLRLYPPTWVYVRVPVEKDTLPSGVDVPPGARLYLSPYLSHRDPRFFDDPERFDPDRFADRDRRRTWQYAYYPFGVGAHRCIGEHLATLEAMLVIASVVSRVRLELVDAAAVKPHAGITLRARRGIPMRVGLRQSS